MNGEHIYAEHIWEVQPFPSVLNIFSNNFQHSKNQHVKSRWNFVIHELSSPCPCTPKDGYLRNLLGTW